MVTAVGNELDRDQHHEQPEPSPQQDRANPQHRRKTGQLAASVTNGRVFEELKGTIHYTNRSGVRASCPDCHVPHNWTDKIARKMQASKEVWGHLFGSIDTREKFLAMRRNLAEAEWRRMKANDSLECRNCHSAESMDLSKQNPRAAAAHERFLFTSERTCIDCHKGIAHRLPNMSGVPGWQ